MSKRNYDEHNRWRNKLVAFRVSPEENDRLDKLVALTGHTKQDYIIANLLHYNLIVYGTPRVYKALRTRLDLILDELERIHDASELDDELLQLIDLISRIVGEMNNGEMGKAPITENLPHTKTDTEN